MTVLVAIPYYRTADYIGVAVEHILRQTYADLVCLVASDGDSKPRLPSDDRLAVVVFDTNEGAPLTQQAMLLGSPFEWYAPHGSDDWVDPEYLSRLLALGGKANGSAALWEHQGAGEYIVRDFVHAEFGVFQADLLRSVGGYGIDRRCGQDTLLYTDILPHVEPMMWLHEPLYHKRMRADSLTHSPATGMGSAYRDEVVLHNRAVAAACAATDWTPEAIRAAREAFIPDHLRTVLDSRVDLVTKALS